MKNFMVTEDFKEAAKRTNDQRYHDTGFRGTGLLERKDSVDPKDYSDDLKALLKKSIFESDTYSRQKEFPLDYLQIQNNNS